MRLRDTVFGVSVGGWAGLSPRFRSGGTVFEGPGRRGGGRPSGRGGQGAEAGQDLGQEFSPGR